ncbi:MAG: phenylalanine--tRNA ligase subunit beta [bacterium]|nr:phenylalanine--tRNA ligase subunit beta [bacterium]
MKFDAEWLLEQLVQSRDVDTVAQALTACGSNVETREASGDSEIWDIEVTTNRPDAMNHRGLAREAAVATGAELRPIEVSLEETDEEAASLATIEIAEPDLCSRYVARVVRGVKIVESPAWMQERLERCGVRPINAIVDATNYVLLELGQPLHAFDLDLVSGRRIEIRRARGGEKLTTLDGEERKVDPHVLVIADDERAIALAGIMGGANTEIHEGTSDVLIESAHFDAVTVRRAARRLGMHTEASHRFERGCDPEMAATACDVAAELIAQLTGGTICKGHIDVYPAKKTGGEISLSVQRLSAFAGLDISSDRAIGILKELELSPRIDGDMVTCAVPSFRVDLECTADLYEEVIRHVGYDAIPSVLPVLSSTPGGRSQNWQLVDRCRDAAVAEGLAEIVTYSFIDPSDDEVAETLPLVHHKPLVLDNALAQTQGVMRRSLMPGIVSGVRDNLNNGERFVALFEQGRAFTQRDGDPHEAERLAIALSGRRGGREVDFGDIKGVVEGVIERIALPVDVWSRGGQPWLDPSEGAILCTAEGTVLGCVGRLSSEMAARWDLRQPAYVAELDLEATETDMPLPEFKTMPRFPAVIADMTVEHDQSLSFTDLEASVRELASELVSSVELVTQFSGKGIDPGKVRTTLRFVYRNPERSLTQDEVNAEQETLRQSLAGRLKVRMV